MLRKPWPLQALWPLQSFLILLQAPWPLQPLTPKQRPSICSAEAVAISVAPEMIRAAAVMAIVAPDFSVSFIFLSCKLLRACGTKPPRRAIAANRRGLASLLFTLALGRPHL